MTLNKTIFIYKDKEFGFISSLDNGCFYASIILIDKKQEIFKTKCLPKKNLDYNGLGSSHIHHNGKIFLIIGAPEQISSEIDLTNYIRQSGIEEIRFSKIILYQVFYQIDG